MITTPTDQEISLLYMKGSSIRQVAENFGCSDNKVRNALIRTRTPIRPQKTALDLPHQEIAERYEAGETISSIAESYGASSPAISRVLRILKVPVRKGGNSKTLTDQQEEQARELYEQGLSTIAIGEQLGIRHQTVQRSLERQGVARRPTGWRPDEIPDVRAIGKRYMSGVTLPEIAKEHGISVMTVRTALNKQGIDKRPTLKQHTQDAVAATLRLAAEQISHDKDRERLLQMAASVADGIEDAHCPLCHQASCVDRCPLAWFRP